uniref:Autophagy-related protein 9 n=1 Tax=Ditylenchus dipsaci TaxID=166011 RepID=A0A915DK59_9BILA
MFFGNRRTYTPIGGDEEEAGDPGQNSDDETNQGAPPISSKRDRRWDHIEDIDQFFTLVYEYHQGNGLICIALRHAFALFQFLFIICFSTFLLQCVDYDVLFANRNITTTGQPVLRKRHIGDAIIPYYAVSFNPLIVIAIMLAAVFWLAHLLRVGYRLIQLWEMKTFYSNVLNIQDDELANVPWQNGIYDF